MKIAEDILKRVPLTVRSVTYSMIKHLLLSKRPCRRIFCAKLWWSPCKDGGSGEDFGEDFLLFGPYA
jgi:hypothetical protein